MTDKERLERIIQMQYDGYTIWDMGENDLVWLIEQAERAEELERKTERYREAIEVAIHNMAASDNLGVKFALGILEQALEGKK